MDQVSSTLSTKLLNEMDGDNEDTKAVLMVAVILKLTCQKKGVTERSWTSQV